MKVLVLAAGSQGDVWPLAALAERLRREGHEAVLAAPRSLRPLAAAARVPFAPLDLDIMGGAETMGDCRGARHLVRLAQTTGRLVAGTRPAAWEAALAGADLVVHNPALPIGQHLAERLGVPVVIASASPSVVPTRSFPLPVWSTGRRTPGLVNRASYRTAALLSGLCSRRAVERWRRQVLRLPRRHGRHHPLRGPAGEAVPVLHAFSAHVLPPPADWPDTAHVTGCWLLPTPPGWTPPRRLAMFLDAGEPPVYIGFGGRPVPDPERLRTIVCRVLDRTGDRAIIASGHHGLRGIEPSDRLLPIRHAPHDWLFPRVRAVVHHGGAGMTGAAAAAGRPQVICPAGADQPFWARRMSDAGVAIAAPPLQAVTGPALEDALCHVLDDADMRDRAEDLGRLIRAEDGTGRAVALVERIADRPRADLRYATAVRGHPSAAGATMRR